MRVHILFEGHALCGAGHPRDWPGPDRWLAWNESDRHIRSMVECEVCEGRAAKRWPEIWAPQD